MNANFTPASLTSSPRCARRLIAAALAMALPILPTPVDAVQDLTQQKLVGRWSNSTPTNYRQGNCTAMSPKYALAGASQAGDTAVNQGAVQVFDTVTGNWLRKLLPPGTMTQNYFFGTSVAVSGNIAVVGAPGVAGFSGLAYVYDLANGALKTTLHANDAAGNDQFGASVAIRGGLIAVGASSKSGGKGAVYLFQLSDGVQVGKIQAADGVAGDAFGLAVVMEGNILGVGAPGVGNEIGAAYFFDLSTQVLITKYTPATAIMGDSAGSTLALHGGLAVLGTQNPDNAKVYAYNVTGGNGFTLVPSDPQASSSFGCSVAVDGNLILVGCAGPFSTSGSVYVFDAESGDQVTKIRPWDAVPSKLFGYSVATCQSALLVGCPADNTQAMSSGATYLIRQVTTPMLFSKVAARGDFAPGAAESSYGTLGDAFVNGGAKVAFTTTLSGVGSNGGKDSAGYVAFTDVASGGTLQLMRRSREDLGGGVKIKSVSGTMVNNQYLAIGKARLTGAGVNTTNDQLLWWATDSGEGSLLRTGSPVMEFAGAPLLSSQELVQSIFGGALKYFAVHCTLRKGGFVNATNDSGIWAANLGTSTEAVREGNPIPSTTHMNGQFTGRVAYFLDRYTYSEALTGPNITPLTNAAIVQKKIGADEAIIVQKGAMPIGIQAMQPVAPGFSAFLGETTDGDENVLYRATVTGSGINAANNEGLWVRYLSGGTTKLQLRKGQSIPGLPGVTVSKFIHYWSTDNVNQRVVALVQLVGTGVKSTNDQALLCVEKDGSVLVVMREGEPAAGCTPATIGTISRVEVDPWSGHYAVVCALAGAPVGTEQALYTGAFYRGNNTDKITLRRPFLRLRKGQLYENQPSRIKSISLPTTHITASGAGGTGRGHAISWNGYLAITVEFDNKVRQIMFGGAQ